MPRVQGSLRRKRYFLNLFFIFTPFFYLCFCPVFKFPIDKKLSKYWGLGLPNKIEAGVVRIGKLKNSNLVEIIDKQYMISCLY